MRSVLKTKVILPGVVLLILGIAGYFLSLAYLQKRVNNQVNQVVEALIHNNSGIKDVHYQSVSYDFIPFFHNKLSIKGLLFSLNRNLKNPLIIDSLTVKDLQQNRKTHRLSFQLDFTNAHFKQFKYTLGFINRSATNDPKKRQTSVLREPLKVAAPSINGTLSYNGNKRILEANLVGLNFDKPFLHFDFSLGGLTITKHLLTAKALAKALSSANVLSQTMDLNVSPTMSVDRLSTVLPSLVKVLHGLGYKTLSFNVAGYSSYSIETHLFKGSVNLQSSNAGKLGLSLIGRPDGLYFQRLFGRAYMFQNKHVTYTNLKDQTMKQFFISGLSLTYEDYSLLNRLLAYYAKIDKTDKQSFAATLKNKLQSIALMTDVPELKALFNKAVAFITMPGRIQIELKPNKPFSVETIRDYFQLEDQQRAILQKSLMKSSPKKKKAELIQAYQQSKHKRSVDLLGSIGFETVYVGFRQQKRK